MRVRLTAPADRPADRAGGQLRLRRVDVGRPRGRHGSRPASRRRCCTTSRFDVPAGPDRRAGRPDRLRQVHASPRSPVRLVDPAAGAVAARRRRRCASWPAAALAEHGRAGAAGRRSSSTTRSAATSTLDRPTCDDERGLGGAAAGPGRRLRRPRCPTGWTPWSASAAPRCPAGSGSGSPWPGRWPAGPGCSCSTTPPARSTRGSRRRSWPGCASGASSARSILVVAYRRATIALADEVVYLEHGRVVARGTPRRAAGHRARATPTWSPRTSEAEAERRARSTPERRGRPTRRRRGALDRHRSGTSRPPRAADAALVERGPADGGAGRRSGAGWRSRRSCGSGWPARCALPLVAMAGRVGRAGRRAAGHRPRAARAPAARTSAWSSIIVGGHRGRARGHHRSAAT